MLNTLYAKSKESKTVLFLLLFLVGMLVFFPFPTFFLGEERHFFQQDVLQWLNQSFGLQLNAQSDSVGMFVLVLFALLFASSCYILLSFMRISALEKYLNTHTFYSVSSFVLAYFLLKYGLDKVFKNQFYAPEISIEYTPIYQLDRDILYWTTMGKSYSYSLIVGILEVIPALLLLSSKTRLLGNLLAVAAFTHILAINIGFDITVKFLASSLLLLAVINVLLNGKALYTFFILQTSISLPKQGFSPKSRFLRGLKFVFFILIVLDCSAVYLEGNRWNGDLSPRSAYYGAYEVKNVEGSGRSFVGETDEIKRIFFHRRPYVIFQTKSDHFMDFGRHFTAKGSILLEKEKKKQELYLLKMDGSTYSLRWNEEKDDTVRNFTLLLRKVPEHARN
jgi:hypothetical protein